MSKILKKVLLFKTQIKLRICILIKCLNY